MRRLILPPDLIAAMTWLYQVGQAGSWNAPPPPPAPVRPGNDNPAAQSFYDHQIAPNWASIVAVYVSLAPFRTNLIVTADPYGYGSPSAP